MTGEFVDLPPETRTSAGPYGGKYNEAVELAKTRPGVALKVETNVERRIYIGLHGHKREPFVTDEGHISVKMRNSKLGSDGKRRGDLYFIWNESE